MKSKDGNSCFLHFTKNILYKFGELTSYNNINQEATFTYYLFLGFCDEGGLGNFDLGVEGLMGY